MEPSHFRGSQPPTSHRIPGYPPLVGIVDPFVSLTKAIETMKTELSGLGWHINERFFSVSQGYTEMNTRFDECVRQTDRILAEQGARLETRLEGIQNVIRQLHDSQTADMATLKEKSDTLKERLDTLECLTEASRKTLDSKVATFVEMAGYTESRFHHLHESNGALPSVEWPQIDLEAETTSFQERSTGLTPIVMSSGPEPPSTPSDNNSEVCESSSTGEPSASTTADINDVTVVSVSPQDLPYNALQDSQDEETPPEEGIHVLYSPPSNLVLRKRKGTSDRQGESRGGKRSRHQVERDPIEENHADPLIWPPVIEGNTSQKYISCDGCTRWYHFGCVALQGDHEDETPWECPPCAQDPARREALVPLGGGRCSRPGCDLSTGQEYFMDRLVGRCHEPNQGLIKYLVAYEGYGLSDCTWEPAESFANDSSKIEEFLDLWATENPTVDVESLDPHETIFIRDAYVYARIGMTWPGA